VPAEQGLIRPIMDLSSEMAELAERLGLAKTTKAPDGPGRVLQFVSAETGEGASTVAREFARHAALTARRGVWLIELDLLRGEQHAAIDADPVRYGPLGEASRASSDSSMFFSVTPKLKGVDGRDWPDARYLEAYPVGRLRWWVTRFRRDVLRPGQSVRILNAPSYWTMLRNHADLVVIDAPSAERSRVALAVAPNVDANILVVAGDRHNTDAPVALRDAIAGSGGYCAGLVFNRAAADPPRFLKSILP
jgi:Mrp family chromosome partitioning ATPase